MRLSLWKLALTLPALLCLAPAGSACPGYVAAKDLPGGLPAGKRRDLRLFALQAVPGKTSPAWVALPLQVDPLDEHGVLLGQTEDGGKLQEAPLAPTDRLTLRREGFGAKLTAGLPAPCKAPNLVELQNPDTPTAYAYLAACTDPPPALQGPVSHDEPGHTIDATRYRYTYQPNNQLMYKSMLAKGPWGSLSAGHDADLAMHIDVANFFTMDFANKDVESYVHNVNTGPVGMVASIDFFLRVLFFKVDLKMATTVGFYGDSAHIPTVIDVPVDSASTLNLGSGILYTWVRGAARIDQSQPQTTMPNADPARILASIEREAAAGLPYCEGDICRFRLSGKIGSEVFALDINAPKEIVARGFYPQWVGDVGAFKKAMGWDDDPQDGPDQVAVFFDNSGLHKGTYRFDEWLRIGQADTVTATCPRAVKALGRVTPAGATAH
jgi:hypothetical protein